MLSTLRNVLSILDAALLEKVEIVTGAEDKTGEQQLKNTFEIISNMSGLPKTLFVWDCDAASIVTPLVETQTVFKYCLPQNEANTKMKNGIENLYSEEFFTEDVYTPPEEKVADNGTIIIKKHIDKPKFLTKIEAVNEAAVFENYRPLIEKMKTLIPVDNVSTIPTPEVPVVQSQETDIQ